MPELSSIQKKYITKIADLKPLLPAVCRFYFDSKINELKPSTLVEYGKDFLLFFTYLCDKENDFIGKHSSELTVNDILSIRQSHIIHFLCSLNSRIKHENDIVYGIDKASYRRICAISSIFAFISDSSGKYYDPTRKFIKQRIKLDRDKDENVLSMEEQKAFFLSVCYGDGLTENAIKKHEKYSLRDTLIFMILLDTGIQVSELVSLNLSDINFQNNTLTLIRNEIEVNIPYSIITSKYMNKYLEIRYYQKEGENAFFLSNQKCRISVRQIERLVKKYAVASIEEKSSLLAPGTFRKTFQKDMINVGADEISIAYMMGIDKGVVENINVDYIHKFVNLIGEKRKIAGVVAYVKLLESTR